MLHKSSPISFNNIATAIGFSPTAKPLLFEAFRIAKAFGGVLHVLHVGVSSPQSETYFKELFAELGEGGDQVKLHYASGIPVDTILNFCKEQSIDLLIAGALQRENLAKYYRGSIARKLSRMANCSLLLITHPKVEPSVCSSIVVNGHDHPKTADTIRTSIFAANRLGANQLIIVEEISASEVEIRVNDDLALIKAHRERMKIGEREHRRVEEVLNSSDISKDLKIKEVPVYGRRGYSIGHFAAKIHADLLIVNSPDTKLGFLDRILQHDIEFLLSELPSDLLIVHSTKESHGKS